MKQYMVGMDIGGTNIRIGASVAGEEVLTHFNRVPTDQVLNSEGRQQHLIDLIQAFIEKELSDGIISGISIGLPATLSRDRRNIVHAPNVSGLDGLNLADILEETFHFKVFLEKDVNMLLLHDVKDNQITERGIILGVYIGTGIGNAISLDGKLLTGKHGVSGELGHIPIIGKKEICTCGNEGCTENYASGKALTALCREHFKNTEISDMFVKYGKDPLLIDFVENIACVIATEINILDPDAIVLGGGVLGMEGFPKKLLEQNIYKHTRKPLPAEEIQFYYAKASQENGVKGAILYGASMLKKQEVFNNGSLKVYSK